jgi:hypothetical protein
VILTDVQLGHAHQQALAGALSREAQCELIREILRQRDELSELRSRLASLHRLNHDGITLQIAARVAASFPRVEPASSQSRESFQEDLGQAIRAATGRAMGELGLRADAALALAAEGQLLTLRDDLALAWRSAWTGTR